jgi:acyl-coenzyme A synthetase/AMP-(fatty) acid ligase
VPIADDPLRADAGRISRRALAAGCQAAILGEEALAGERRLDPEALPVLHRLVLEATWDRTAPSGPAPGGPASVVSAASEAGFIFGDASGRLYSVSRVGLALQGISSYRFLLDGRGEGDRHLVITPLHHSSFVVAALGTILAGGTLVVLEGGLRAESGPALVADVVRTGARVAVLQARHLTRIQATLAADPAVAPGPEVVVLEGEAVTPGLYQAVRQAFAARPSHVTQVVSRPESGGYLAGPYPPVCPVRPAAAGLSAPGLPLLIVDDHGKPCPESHGGFVAIAQAVPSLAVELAAQPLPVTIGVRARRDRDGLLWTVGEVQMEVAEVEPVSAPEIEAHVAGLDGVHEVAVVRSHPADGRPRTWVFARLDPERIDVARIRAAITSHLGERAAPDEIYAVERLPYSRSGKLLRTVLKRIAVGDTAGLDGEGLVADPEAVRQLILRCQGGESPR